MAWFADGLPVEGERAAVPDIGRLASLPVPTCDPRETVDRLQDRLRGPEGPDFCLVLNPEGVVLGRVRGRDLDRLVSEGADRPVVQVMEPDPSTFRPNVSAKEMLTYMQQHRLAWAVVTTLRGTLVGALRREDVERAVRRPGGSGEEGCAKSETGSCPARPITLPRRARRRRPGW